MLQAASPALILASASSTRRRLLASAGVAFEAIATRVDEGAVKQEARVLGSTPEATALRLARLKAQAIDRPEALILGCDQILVCDGIWYDKPVDLEAARAHLRALRGRPHPGSLLSQRWRALQHVMVSPTTIGDLAKAALVLTLFEHKMIS